MDLGVQVDVLRRLLRNLQAWRALYEDSGVDEVMMEGESYSLWDLERLVDHLHLLSPRQAEAIRLCLIEGMREVDAARMMGVSSTNPVAMYATDGLKRFLELSATGVLGFSLCEVA